MACDVINQSIDKRLYIANKDYHTNVVQSKINFSLELYINIIIQAMN